MSSTRSSPAIPLAAAIQRFPTQAGAIRQLMSQSEAFRDMCEELAEAEAALARIGTQPTERAAERRAECEGWIDRLVDEMARALECVNVVPLASRNLRE